MEKQNHNISIKELCQRLSVSEATGRNWMRLGKIVPDKELKGTPYFSEQYVRQLLAQLKNEDAKELKNRRNKKYVSGASIYAGYLPKNSANLTVVSRIVIAQNGQPPEEIVLREILAECALQLLEQALGKKFGFSENYLFYYRQGRINLGEYDGLLRDLLERDKGKKDFSSIAPQPLISEVQYSLKPGEDVLGMLYLSLKNLGLRKAFGAYYTPGDIVQRLLEDLQTEEVFLKGCPLKILDPCCGTGNFLLQLTRTRNIEELYGGDIDALAVQLARINLAIACPDAPVTLIRERIQVRDFLDIQRQERYDIILGNPPWGSIANLSRKQPLERLFFTGQSKEAYDLFLEKSFLSLRQGGIVAFVLPEAVLYVKSHQKIRMLMTRQSQIKSIHYLGNAFPKVQCPAVILKIQKTGKPLQTCGIKICCAQREFQIKSSRRVNAECFNFHMPDEEYEIFHKIESHQPAAFLKGQADFALGIVTGNNQRYIRKEQTAESEAVLKGSDIEKYYIRDGNQYLVYQPEQFQQTAPEQCYRAQEKLFYRFIGKNLVFAYDDRQRLSLNSCNILIPKIPGMDIKYILAVLNSRLTQFVYDGKFRSMKVLRSYLEQLPIPIIPKERQLEIMLLAEQVMAAPDRESWDLCYQEADQKIASAFGLTEKEYLKVCSLYPLRS